MLSTISTSASKNSPSMFNPSTSLSTKTLQEITKVLLRRNPSLVNEMISFRPNSLESQSSSQSSDEITISRNQILSLLFEKASFVEVIQDVLQEGWSTSFIKSDEDDSASVLQVCNASHSYTHP